eukprot:6730124-Alexandrium_andersonii.AAC.1
MPQRDLRGWHAGTRRARCGWQRPSGSAPPSPRSGHRALARGRRSRSSAPWAATHTGQAKRTFARRQT